MRPSLQIPLKDFFMSGLIREIDCLRNRILTMLLHRSLHGNMIIRTNIHRCHKHIFNFFWNCSNLLKRSLLDNFVHQLVRVDSLFFKSISEMFVDTRKLHISSKDCFIVVSESKIRLNTTRNVVHHRNSSSWSNVCDCCVSPGLATVLKNRKMIIRKVALLFPKLDRHIVAFRTNQSHHLPSNLSPSWGIVSNFHLVQHISKSHNPKTNSSIRQPSTVHSLNRKVRQINDIIQKSDSQSDSVFQSLNIHLSVRCNKFLQIDTPKITDITIMKKLFPARIASLDWSKSRNRISLVYSIQENTTRFSHSPSTINNLIEKFASCHFNLLD
mmetsp:Transcript_20323/g.28045  ORF Transcript_20323/g.28045 Transcript_20323/m.28045 type:complete len:327 (+) Transcript_20323:566-1546(+)